ncbi:rho GTPase-activating protein 19 [Astyanax mexicanus]|uniref:Rho GTPase-activating protein 19 n=1 Tax=Astyanax mexicanus TaxID=7994 RepID=A0A8B9K4J8_ASTMX|nr:rho GTPase-activating protein 19 [Astyanax mexicanus]
MAAEKECEENKQNRRGTVCNIVISQEMPQNQPVIFNPDFFVEKLRHEKPHVFTELLLSNVTRLMDLPGAEFSQLQGESELKLPASTGFLRLPNFLKRKEKGVVFGAPLTEEGIAQIYQLIEYLGKNLHVEGLFRVPGNSIRQQALREMLNAGADIDLETGDYHPHDVATLLKTFLGELPEPLLTHRHYHAHLKIAEMTLFDEKGNKTSVPHKERQIEALQLLFMLLPPANRSLLKLLLDLLYQTAKKQDKNKMSAHNLAIMFAPHIIWPKNVTASNLQDNLHKLNSGISFLIKHSQKLFRAPSYIKDHARMLFTGSRTPQSKDDMELCSGTVSRTRLPSKRSSDEHDGGGQQQQQHHTQDALRDLFNHVTNMPESAKKKKLIRQFNKQGTPVRENTRPPSNTKHGRSRSLGGLIKKKVLGSQLTVTGTSQTKEATKGSSASSIKRTPLSPAQQSSLSLP